MNVAEQDENAVLTIVRTTELRNFVELARVALHAPLAMLQGADREPLIYCPSDPADGLIAAAAQLEATVTRPGADDRLGVLVVADTSPRDWTAADRDTLSRIAACLSSILVAHDEATFPSGRRDAHRDGVGADGGLSTQGIIIAGVGGETREALQRIIDVAVSLRAETRPDLLAAGLRAIRATSADVLASVAEPGGAGSATGGSPDETREHEPVQPESVNGSADWAASGMDSAGPNAAEMDDGLPNSAHILIADDLDLNRKLISDMLSIEGHVVDSVSDGASAVKAAGERTYDLILMDMIMPGMDGVAATRAIRALPAPACDVPIVALTAHSLPEQLDSCIQAGMDATLTKPMSMDALTDAVATWKRRRRTAA